MVIVVVWWIGGISAQMENGPFAMCPYQKMGPSLCVLIIIISISCWKCKAASTPNDDFILASWRVFHHLKPPLLFAPTPFWSPAISTLFFSRFSPAHYLQFESAALTHEVHTLWWCSSVAQHFLCKIVLLHMARSLMWQH